MSATVQLLILLGGVCLGAFVTNAIWLGVFRRYVALADRRAAIEVAYSDKMQQRCGNSPVSKR